MAVARPEPSVPTPAARVRGVAAALNASPADVRPSPVAADQTAVAPGALEQCLGEQTLAAAFGSVATAADADHLACLASSDAAVSTVREAVARRLPVEGAPEYVPSPAERAWPQPPEGPVVERCAAV